MSDERIEGLEETIEVSKNAFIAWIQKNPKSAMWIMIILFLMMLFF